MRSIWIVLFPAVVLFGNGEGASDETPIVEEEAPSLSEKPPLDYQALEEWISDKHVVMGKGLPGNLIISGEVRAEMQKKSEVVNNIKQRGGAGAVNVPTTNYDVELNLMFNYRAEITWANVKIEFDNNAGIFNGSTNHIALERAFLGVRLFETDAAMGAVEFGRRILSYTFDSQVQFGSYMDGILLKFNRGLGFAGEFYLNFGPFLVDEKKSQYAYVGELGLLNICNSGVYLKYSLIDWDTKSFSNPREADKFRFLNGQWTLGYKFVPPWIAKVITLYGAILVNHAAKPLAITANRKANMAWYVGTFIGEARQKGDWALSANYQWVQANAVPQFDVNGIGTGNASGANLYDASSAQTARGNTNYKGFSFDLLYLFTDNITLQQSYAQSIREQTDIGPPFRNKVYEMELIYAF